MKAVLVLDEMPEGCWTCKFLITTGENAAFNPDDYFCFLHGNKGSVKKYDLNRPDFCLLHLMPEVKPGKNLPEYDTDIHYEIGWNNCLRTIEGSGEDG